MWKNKWLSMLLLVTMVFMLVPVNAAQAYDSASLEQIFKSVDVVNGGNWYKSSTNESSTLAWGESYVMGSYLAMYRATQNDYYLQKFINHANSVLANRDSVRGVTIYNGKSLPAWRVGPASGLKTTGFFHLIVETGMISYPFADFANMVNHTPALAKYQATADTYLQAAKDAVAAHDQDWREQGNTGYYIYTPGGPFWADGIPVPFNQYTALARTQLAIYQATGETAYLDRVTKMAQHLKNSMTYNAQINGYTWNYWYGPGQSGWTTASGLSKNTPSYGGYRSIEDVAHGAIEADFVYSLAQTGIVFNQTDLQRIGNTIKTQIISRTDGKAGYGFGITANPYPYPAARVGLLLAFDQLAPGLFDFTYNLRSSFSGAKGPGLLAAGLLNQAFYDRNNPVVQPPVVQPPVVQPPVVQPPVVEPPVVEPPVVQPPAPQPDTTAPQVTLISPADSGALNGILLLQAKASDNVAIQTVSFEYTTDPTTGSWQTLGPATGNAGVWEMSLNTANITEGVYYLRAVAVDTAGNRSESQPVSITIDRTSPAVAVVTPTPAATGVSTGTVIKATFSEDVLNVNASSFTVSGVTGKVTYDTATRTAVFTPGQALAQGTTYTVNLGNVIKDRAGNSVQYRWDFTTEKPVAPVYQELVVNGNFSQGATGWNSGTIGTESNGNKYISNGYNWTVRQDISVVPGTQYVLNARTKKGTAAAEARIVLIYNDAAGKKLGTDDFLYRHKGSTWESFPQQTVTPPAGTAKVTVYLLVNGGTGTHSFDDISLKTVVKELLVNGDFTQSLTGWNTGTIGAEANGNKFVANGYDWSTRQSVQVTPGAKYVLNAQTKKGAAPAEARVVVAYLDAAGTQLRADSFLHRHTGTGWESFPAQTLVAPAGAVKATVYLLVNGGSGTHSFDNVSLTNI